MKEDGDKARWWEWINTRLGSGDAHLALNLGGEKFGRRRKRGAGNEICLGRFGPKSSRQPAPTGQITSVSY